MLISPPFLLTRDANETDDAWIDRCMDGGAPGDGAFPVSFKLGWHGGMHLNAPMNGAQPEAVRAVADGEVMFLRQPTAQPAGPLPPTHPQAYNGWTDNGVVVIRHTTEIGEGANAAVVFFSIYMHLSAIDPAIQRGRAVYRKAALGIAGQIYGNAQRQIHFEIVCDDANVTRLAGRASGDLPLTVDGRTDAIYGEMYFHLPAGTQVFAQQPLPSNAQAMMQPPGRPALPPQPLQAAHTTANEFIVGLRHAGGEGAVADRGDAYLTSYQLDGTALGAALQENDAEYNLYTTATSISRAYPATGRPAPSAVYELLRFGRVIGPGKVVVFTLTVCWRSPLLDWLGLLLTSPVYPARPVTRNDIGTPRASSSRLGSSSSTVQVSLRQNVSVCCATQMRWLRASTSTTRNASLPWSVSSSRPAFSSMRVLKGPA